MKRAETGRIDTRLIHAGEPEPRILGAVAMPVFQATIYEQAGTPSYHDIQYIRLNNTPNHVVLHAKLAVLENAEAALVTGSGMAAISTSLLTCLSAGDHLLVQDNLYGGTHDFVTHDLPLFGIAYDFIDADDPGSWAGLLRDTTRAIYVETMTNPLLQVGDLAAVPRFAREHGLVSLIDNTFATPVNFRPPEYGFDLSLHSATKYLNGHSDIVAGAVIGRADLVEKVRLKLNHLGGSLDPHACSLLHRGLKTLARHRARPLSRPRHARARELFSGFDGVVSFEVVGGGEAAARFIERPTLPRRTVCLGGVEDPDHPAGPAPSLRHGARRPREGGRHPGPDPPPRHRDPKPPSPRGRSAARPRYESRERDGKREARLTSLRS